MALIRTSTAVITALVAAFVYYRSGIIYTFYANAPGRFQHINHLSSHQVRFESELRNCEDIYLDDKAGFALISCDPGRDEWNTVMGVFVNPIQPPETGVYLYRYAESPDSVPVKLNLKPSQSEHVEFHPLGIEFHSPSNTMFVANHLSSGSRLDVFALDIESASATLVRSVTGAQIAAPNSIAAISESELLVTNDHYFLAKEHPFLAKIETYAGIPGGSIVYVNLSSDGPAEIHTLAHLPFANGVVFLNASTVAVASCAGSLIQLYNLERHTSEIAVPKLSTSLTVSVPFIPDNLSLDQDGKLLIAGHPHAPSIEKVSLHSRFCNTPENSTLPECQLPRLSSVAEWDEQHGLQVLYAGDEFGTITTAVRDVARRVGFAVGLYERGLLSWKV